MLIIYTLKQSAGTWMGAGATASGTRDATRYINGLIAAVIGKLILFMFVEWARSGKLLEYK